MAWRLFPQHLAATECGRPSMWPPRYTHKTSSYITSSYKTSSYKTSIYQMSGYRMSRLQNVQVSKRPNFQTSILQNIQIAKHPGHKTSSFFKFKNLFRKTFFAKYVRNCILYAVHALRPAKSKVVVKLCARGAPILTQLCGCDTHAFCSSCVMGSMGVCQFYVGIGRV